MIYLAATDWNEVTGIATGALALRTFGLVISAIIAAVLARRNINTQLWAQEMAQHQIEASYRPLLRPTRLTVRCGVGDRGLAWRVPESDRSSIERYLA
jgi:hypothetical protein